MKLLESYANSCSVDIKYRPVLYEKYFPLGTINRYITLQSHSAMPAKNYSYFGEVLNILKPYLDKEKIKVIHLGQGASPIDNTINLNDKTSLGQAAYIIKKSSLHLTVDSWSCHFSCNNEIPTVSLYGSTTVENHSPYHYNPDKTIFIESERKGFKASFSREEQPLKMIDLIKPEEVAKSVCKLLNIPFSYNYKTIKINSQYQFRMLESLCDNVINIQTLGAQNIIMRMDLNYNLTILENQLKFCPCIINTNQNIPIELLLRNKQNVLQVIYEINNKYNNPDFVKQLIENKIKYRLISYMTEEELNKIKWDYIDFDVVQNINPKIPNELKDRDLEKIYMKSSKILLANQKFYNSEWALKNNISFHPGNSEPIKVKDKYLDILWKEQDNMCFMEKLD